MPLFHTEFSQVKLNFWNLCRKSISDIFLRFSMVLFYQQKFRTKHVRWSPNWAYWVSNWANWCSNLVSPIKYFLCFTNNCFMKVYNFNSIKTKSILDIKRPLLEQKKIISFERKIDMICKCGSRGQVHGLFVSSSWFTGS